MAVKTVQSGKKPGILARIRAGVTGFIVGTVGSILMAAVGGTLGSIVLAGLALFSGEFFAAAAILFGGPILAFVASGPFTIFNAVRGAYLDGAIGPKGLDQLVSEMIFQEKPLFMKWYAKFVGKEEIEISRAAAPQSKADTQASTMVGKEKVSMTTVKKVDPGIVKAMQERIKPPSPYSGCSVRQLDNQTLCVSGKPELVAALVKGSTSLRTEDWTISGQGTNKVDQLALATKGLNIKKLEVGDKHYTYSAAAGGFQEVSKGSSELQHRHSSHEHTFTPAMQAAISQKQKYFSQPQPTSTKQQQPEGPPPTSASDFSSSRKEGAKPHKKQFSTPDFCSKPTSSR